MYCKKCGRKLKDEKTYCTYCGQGREEDVPISEEEKKKNPAANVNYKSIGVLCIILSVFIPIIGLILAIIYLATMKNNKDMEVIKITVTMNRVINDSLRKERDQG